MHPRAIPAFATVGSPLFELLSSDGEAAKGNGAVSVLRGAAAWLLVAKEAATELLSVDEGGAAKAGKGLEVGVGRPVVFVLLGSLGKLVGFVLFWGLVAGDGSGFCSLVTKPGGARPVATLVSGRNCKGN